MSFLMKIIASFSAGAIVKVFKGISGPIFDHYKSEGRIGTQRQGIWASALVQAAQTDVEHRKLAQQERASNPLIMFLFLNIIGWPTLYWSLFWADTIFAEQVWTVFGFEIWNWVEYELPRAPERLEAYGKEVIQWGFGFGASSYGLIKGAKVLKGSGILGKR